MSVLKTFDIALDMKQELYVAPFTLYQSDTGNRFVITLTDDGTAVDLTGCRVSVVFSGAMGTAIQDSWTGTGDVSISGTNHNIITADIHTGAFANGLNTCQVEVYSGVDYGTLITSAFFTFQGEKPILDDDTIQAAESYPTLVYWAGVVEGLATREQSDWTQTDDTQGNFIQHKPVVGTDIQDATQNLTAETTLSDTDTVPFYDASATAHRKSTWANIVAKIRTALFGSITGVVKADGAGNISAATANTDFAAATHASRHAVGAADALTDYVSISAQTIADAGQTQARTNVSAAKAVGGVIDAIESGMVVNAQTDNYTAVLDDVGKDVWITAATAKTFTIPLQSSVAFVNKSYFFLTRGGAGSLAIAGAAGVTVNSAGNRLKIAEQYGTVLIRRTAENVWLVTGGTIA